MRAKIEPKNRNGRISIEFMLNGERYALYGLGDYQSKADMQKAELLCRQIQSDVLEGTFDTTLERYKQGLSKALKKLEPPLMTFQYWVTSLEVNFNNYTLHYKPVCNWIAKTSPGSYTVNPIPEEANQLSAKSFNQRLSVLKRFGKWLVDEGYLAFNPYAKIKRKKVESEELKPLTSIEVKSIVEFISHENPIVAAYYWFSFLTGCRPSEVIGLRESDIDTENKTITIRETLSSQWDESTGKRKRVRKETKTGDTRVLPISDEIKTALDMSKWEKERLEIASNLIFCNLKGSPLCDNNMRNRHWKPALEALGIPYRRPYATRHTAASMVIENGGTLADAAKLLGHKNLVQVSQTYGHAIKEIQLPSYE